MDGMIAKPHDNNWNKNKQHCWDLLVAFVGGEHYLEKVYHHGDGLQMSTWLDLATFDFDLLTWLVVLAHRDRCRVSIGSSGPGRVAVRVWSRQPKGGSFRLRHPGLDDLIKRAERAKPVQR